MKYLKYFEEASAYEAYKNGSDFITPNVSYVVDNNIVCYHPYEAQETRVVCTYNVTDTTSATKVCNDTSNFTSMEVNGVLQDSVTTEYTFNTVGEHTVKFELADPTIIGNTAFRVCKGLTSITIPDSVTSIGDSAFYNCSGLTSITIPDSVTSIGNSTFYYCTGLTSINIPDSVTSIGNSTFMQCKSLTSINIPDSVTSIGNSAFNRCSGLTSITIPNSVTSIGDSAFSDCSGLTGELIIPDLVTSIGERAFGNCSGLISITIPDSVTSIGDSAFWDCSELTSITSYAVIAPTIGGSNTFRDVKNGGVLKVPTGSDYGSWMSTSWYYLGCNLNNWTIEYI